MNSLDDLTPECLGYAGLVYEHVLVSSSTSALCVGGELLSVWCVSDCPLFVTSIGRGQVYVY